MSPLAERVLELAAKEVGTREEGGRNCGPRVAQYLAAVGLPPGHPWCAAFCYFILDKAARELKLNTACPRTGKVVRMWKRGSLWVASHPSPGSVFIHLTDPEDPETTGHCGIVESVGGTHLVTIEGNTNQAGSREGDGVYRKMRPTLGSNYITGYLDFAKQDGNEDPTVSGRA